VIVSVNYLASEGSGFGVKWDVPGFNLYSSNLIYQDHKGILFPDSIPISVIRQIGADNKGASIKDLAIAVLGEFHKNGLYTAKVNKDRSITIGKSKLTDKKYSAALKNLKKTDKDGFTPAEQKTNSSTNGDNRNGLF